MPAHDLAPLMRSNPHMKSLYVPLLDLVSMIYDAVASNIEAHGNILKNYGCKQ